MKLTSGKVLREVTVYERVISLAFEDARHDVTLRRENGKLVWKNKQAFTVQDLAEVKNIAKRDGVWQNWKSASYQQHLAEVEARHAAGEYHYEDEYGHMHIDRPQPSGTWYSDQDENRML